MGTCSSTPKAVKWEERWSSPSCKQALHQFCDKNLKPAGQAIITGTTRLGSGAPGKDTGSDKFSGPVSKDGMFRNWAGTVQTSPARVFEPKSTSEVQQLLEKVRTRRPMPKVRCMGSSHSWSPHFADDGAWMVDTSGINHLQWSADQPKQVTIGPGVTGGQLATYMDDKERGIWRGLFLASDVVLESVTYGGVINAGCHGTGHTQTLPDYVMKTSIVKWDGTQLDLVRADDPAGFALKVMSLGLLGVTVGKQSGASTAMAAASLAQQYTLQLDGDVNAVRVTDSKVAARMMFLDRNELPTPGGKNPLREAWNGSYGVEIFYLPASSLKITHILSNEFEDQKWDPYNDVCAVKSFQRTKNAVKKDNDRFLGANPKTSTRFDRNFSITDYLRINVGAELGLPLVAKFGDKPALVALYSRAAARAIEPIGKMSGQVHYETSLAQAIHWQRYITDGPPVSDMEVCIKCDPDFASAYKAIHAAIGTVKDFAENEDTMPLNVALEMRFTKHSTSPMSPAYGREGDVFIWIEVLSAVKTPRLKDFTTRVADAWLAIKLKDGSQATYPHWAKWTESYVANADAKMRRAYASRLRPLRQVAREFDPHGIFVNDYFETLLAP